MDVGAYEAKTHLSRLLDEVAQGKRFTITKHGVGVAALVPLGPGHHQGVAQVIDNLKRFQMGITLGDQDLRRLIEEGRR
ncbi:MAG TPA: type II toxin-antitoxin system prevent-host-death family antitoxin [Candidatus Dormibacteraeota bacterium]|nr:type II toxin-antitoxin system prevent-host-death family antitoxin [Candidatus Dormibacteraeota bacterium]